MALVSTDPGLLIFIAVTASLLLAGGFLPGFFIGRATKNKLKLL